MKSLLLPGYVRPHESHGSNAVVYLNKLLELGISLTGVTKGMNTCGFNLCYELMTGSMNIKYLPAHLLAALAVSCHESPLRSTGLLGS